MSYYQHHVFFCLNQRDSTDSSCGNCNAAAMQTYAKERIKALRLQGKGKVRINSAGCLGRCDQGPVMVVYPEGVWYTYANQNDIDEIIDSHLVNGQIVSRLQI